MNQETLKILVVDDDKEVAEILGKLIEVDGYDVVVSYDAQTALENYRRDKFDLVFADISMPGMDGIELTQKLLEFDEKARVVVITGHVGSEEVDRAIQVGAKKFLKKPFAKSEIDKTFQEILGSGQERI